MHTNDICICVCADLMSAQRSLYADSCAGECSSAIAYYQTNNCPKDSFAGQEVAALRRDLNALAW